MSLWHSLSSVQVVANLNTSGDVGLTEAEASARLLQHGRNEIATVSARFPVLRRLLRQFHNILLYVLIASGIVALAFEHWVDGGVIFGVVLLNALVGFVQEGRAESALDAVRQMVSHRASVLRDGGPARQVPAATVVPGDVVVLALGDHVPADVRLLQVSNLLVDEAVLTGEAVPVDKSSDAIAADSALGDRVCMAYAGTVVVGGKAVGVVVETGARTELGRIGKMLAVVDHGETPLLRQLTAFGRLVTAFIFVIVVLMVLAGHFWRNIPISDIVVAGVGVAVAAIPEGLPLIMTISLAIGVRRMAARNALVRRLPAVETLGSVTVICSDKTGTLTRSEMTVQQVSCAGADFGVSGVGYAPSGEITERASGNRIDVEAAPRALSALLESAVLCNDASLVLDSDKAGSDTWTARGNPTEAALLTLAHKGGVDFGQVRASRPRIAELPFDSGHQYMASLHHTDAGSLVLVKGAPERVLEMCRKKRKESAVGARRRAGLQMTLDGGTERLSLSRWRDAIESAGRAGHRVLAFAQLELPAAVHALTRDQVEHDLTFVGIVALMDPPRAEAIEAIAQCREAGVRVVMITGDHGATASAIAQQIGLRNGDRFVLGSEVQELSDDALRQRAAVTNVFARASPEHKLRLVQALQRNDEVVAMTGDGVNDAPALKQANIGVAMGLKGTEVAKQAAAIVLADDNFQSIAAAVEEGRGVYDKLIKAICYMLPVNVAEAGTFLAAILFGVPLPISAVQVLWINMIDSVILALGLAFDATSHDVMHRPPRSPKQRLLTRFVLWRIVLVATILLCGVFGLYEWSRLNGDSPQVSSTVAANTLVSMIAFYLLSVRLLHASALRLTRDQIWRSVLAIAAVYSLQAIFTYAPFMQALFGTAHLGGMAILLIGVVSLAMLAVIEIEKIVWRWWTQQMLKRKRHSEMQIETP